MCGRYNLFDFKPDEMRDRFEIDESDIEFLNSLEPSYNIAPSQRNPVITKHSPNHIEVMRWGLIPFWAKDLSIGYKMINARAEGIESKTSFRKAFKYQRCLVPASGFYEWRVTDSGKVPYLIHLKKQPLFAFAGLYEMWKDVEGKEIKSYTIITTQPNDLMATIHNRMPVILNKEDEELWLNPDVVEPERLLSLLTPYPEKEMEAYPISTKVNSPKNNEPSITQEVDEQTSPTDHNTPNSA
jgi:putative SOS response-associated peptidase YedK